MPTTYITIGIADPGRVELTDDEVIALVEKMGFCIEKHEVDITTPYIHNPAGMLHSNFQASHWVARKR